MPLKKILKEPHNKKIVVIDIDMTVANNNKRLMSSLVAGEIDYEKLFGHEQFKLDQLINGCRVAIDKIRDRYHVLYLSARRCDVYEPTKEWLESNDLFEEGDYLVLVDCVEDKKAVLDGLDAKIKLYIDDFGYNYHKEVVEINHGYILYLKEKGIPFVVFNNNWLEIMERYFNGK
jgi:hypothetical protein